MVGQPSAGPGTGAATVPGFGLNTPQSQVFQSGQGQLSGPGTAKIIDCANQAPEVDSYRRQECDAVNFVARNPAVRPAFQTRPTPTSSPMRGLASEGMTIAGA